MSLARSQSSAEVVRKLSASSDMSSSHNTSSISNKHVSKTKHKPKKKIICEEVTDTRPRTYGRYAIESLEKK